MTKSPWEQPTISLGDGETAVFHGEYDSDGTFIVRDIEKVAAGRGALREAIAALEAETVRLKAWQRRLIWAMALNLAWAFGLMGLSIYRLFWG